jgi:HlyD family secretion protein
MTRRALVPLPVPASFLALFVAIVLTGCNGREESPFQGWIEADLIFVSPDEMGRIEEMSVREGVRVARRAPLFTLDDELQRADVAEREAALENARAAYERAATLMKTKAGTQKALEDAEAALRSTQARLNSARTRLTRRRVFSPVEGTVQQVYFRAGEIVPAGRPVVALLPPANVKVRFFVPEAILPQLSPGDDVAVHCDGCPAGLSAKISFIARTAEYTPPVIYSMEERSKLVFMVEARPAQPEQLRVGQPVGVRLLRRDKPQ